MNESTVKEKYIRIDSRYVHKDIIFRIDAVKPDTLEMVYNLVAVNGSFTSIPLSIDLTKDTTGLINQLKLTKNFVEAKWEEDIYRFVSPITNTTSITIDKDVEKDDLNRECVSFGYLINSEFIELIIPVVIYPNFIDTFIDILERRDIITNEQQDTEDDKENNSSTDQGDESVREDSLRTERVQTE